MAPRSPSRSSEGGASDHQLRAEHRIIKAIEAGDKQPNVDAVVSIIEAAQASHQAPTSPTGATLEKPEKPAPSNPPVALLLRIGLARAAERDRQNIVAALLKLGAKPDGAPGGRVSPLLKAVEKGHIGVVRLLLSHGGNLDVCDKQGRTALMTAAWKNHYQILEELLRRGADVNKRDLAKRNVLHNLAADKHNNWGSDVINLILSRDIAIDGPDGQDELKRSPLHWAAVTGKRELCEMLLRRQKWPRANVNAVEIREKTALHLAAAHGRDDIVEVLLRFGANIKAKSDGSWTPLHNACENGSVRIVRLLLAAGAELNARLLNGMTPLHVAAQAGHLEVVQCLLERKDLKRAARDAFGITPFLRAAQNKRKDIVNVLAPFNHVDTLSEDALGACNGFNATIVDFANFHDDKSNRVKRRTVFELLYGRDPINPRKPAVTIHPIDTKSTNFRWIHLPANNMAWVEALLTKAFIEEGASDVEGFKALERSFTHQHRGQQIHSHFMRPLCQSTPRAPRHADESDMSGTDGEQGPPQIIVQGVLQRPTGLGIDATPGAQEKVVPKTPSRTNTAGTNQTDWTTGSGSAKERGKGKEKMKKTAKAGNTKQGKSGGGGTNTPTKHTDHHSRKKTTQTIYEHKHLRSPGSPGRKDPTQTAKGNIFTFMPYLHFETNKRRQEMQDAIYRAQTLKDSSHDREHPDNRSLRHEREKTMMKRASTYDEMLLRAHLTSSTVSLHVRRTLDQFFYHNIDTQSRDEDQVVYRYQTKNRTAEAAGIDPKIFMVDQLWMWILGKDLIVTSFPQRWCQPKNDPLNVLDGIIEDINSKTREPVRTVYDLAIIISGRCCGVFDRHRMGDEDYQFLDMFESSIGDATDRETMLFKEFNTASAQASAWLQHHRRPNRFSQHLEAEGRVIEHQNRHTLPPHSHAHALTSPPVKEENVRWTDEGPIHAPLFVDKLLDIGEETDLLAEAKDIRDELNMITKVLEDQRSVLPDLETAITDIYREEHRSQIELKKRFREQVKTIEMCLKDVQRMDSQAKRIYESITDLLDLKQKHANAFEARFARDQAAGTARQSQTIMVFTIVTIIFLPLSFIAAIFTVNVQEFPHDRQTGNPSLPFKFVAKWMFGMGFAVSLPLIAIALSLDAIGDFFREFRRRVGEWRRGRKDRAVNNTMPGGGTDNGHGSLETVYNVDMVALQNALSAGRSARGRQSVESNYLLPVTSRGTARTSATMRRGPGNGFTNGYGKSAEVEMVDFGARGGMGGNGGKGFNGQGDVVQVVERMSTGFRIRKSGDVERG